MAGVKETGKKIICSICNHMEPEYTNGGRNCFYCMHPEAKTETTPHRRIAQSREKEIPTKTAPRWCPLKKKEETK